jgi:hypothetical protein
LRRKNLGYIIDKSIGLKYLAKKLKERGYMVLVVPVMVNVDGVGSSITHHGGWRID